MRRAAEGDGFSPGPGRCLTKKRSARPEGDRLCLREYRLPEGIVLCMIASPGALRESTHAVSRAAQGLQLVCCLEGSITESLSGGAVPSSTLLKYSPGQSGLVFAPETARTWTFAPGPCRMVMACIPPRMVVNGWKTVQGEPPDILKALTDDVSSLPFSVELPATPALRMAARSLMDMPVHPGWRERYLHCKVTELFLLATSSLFARQASSRAAPLPLTRKDIACLRTARDLLVARMEDPPPLKALSRLVGINECKLKRGFRQLFGTTPYDYLRQARLDQAYRYLEKGTMGVCEACLAVGYTSPSNFISLFRRRYGLTPGEARRQTLRSSRDAPVASGLNEP